jgi:hypothetical protein
MKPARPLLPATLASSQATVHSFWVFVVAEGPAHHKLALALVAAANVFADEDVAGAGKIGASEGDLGAVHAVCAVGSALDEQRQRRGDVGGFENHGVELDAVAHGNHDLGALVVVKLMMDGRASAAVDGAGLA